MKSLRSAFQRTLGGAAIPPSALSATFGFGKDAMWGHNWGTMIWGLGNVNAVPTIGPLGLVGLALVLLVLGRYLVRSERAAQTLGALAVFITAAVPLAAHAVPNLFSNGTVADASQVNANFGAIETRIAALEAKTASIDGVAHFRHEVNGLGGPDSVIDTLDDVALVALRGFYPNSSGNPRCLAYQVEGVSRRWRLEANNAACDWECVR